ncbi:MAG: hypothetical protein JNK85_27220 [Verrucomicrobiales bacterium]|nr:hypothetical protein [Verrucomicrobiales bacterium]
MKELRILLGIVPVLCLLAFTQGCASRRIDWATRIGSYSYDDAIREMGPPDKSAKLSDGSTVADWLTSRGSRTITSYGREHYPYGAYGMGPNLVVVDPPMPDRFLRLTFDPQGKLASWQRAYR